LDNFHLLLRLQKERQKSHSDLALSGKVEQVMFGLIINQIKHWPNYDRWSRTEQLDWQLGKSGPAQKSPITAPGRTVKGVMNVQYYS
jgi:hypothetical protein